MTCAITIALTAGARQEARGTIVSPIDLPSLVNKSDEIVVARVSLSSVSSASIAHINIAIEVLGTLKGNGTPRTFSVSTSMDGPSGNWGPPRANSIRIVFLRHSDDQLVVADPVYPSLPAVSIPLPGGTDDPLGEVLEEEAAVLGSLTSSWSEKEEAINLLGLCKDPRARAALRSGLTSSSPVVRLESISRLAKLGDPTGISMAVEALNAPPSNLPDNVIQNLNVGIRDGARSEVFVPQLATLLSSVNSETREAAAESLMRIASPSATVLLFRALWDDDKKVRYFAVVGLAQIKGDRAHTPNFPEFQTDEARYTNYWRQQQP